MSTKLVTTKTVDCATGEILDGQLVLVPRKAKSTFSKQGFVIMAMIPAKALSLDTTFNATARVLFACLAELDYSNYVRIEQAKLAKEMGIQPQNFSRAITKLVEQGVLLRGPKRTLMLNSDIAYRGDAKNQAAIRQHQSGFKLIQGGASA